MKELEKLLEIQTVSGYEYKNMSYIQELFNNIGLDVFSDNIYNVIGLKKGTNAKYNVLVDAHFDTIGLMVSDILEGGFLSFVSVGGVDTRVLPALSVTIHGKENIKGVIGVKPPHLISDGYDKTYKIEDLFIDTGYSYEKICEYIEVGDIISFNSDITYLLNNQLSCCGLDNKAGVYSMYEIIKNVCNDRINLYGIASVGEETGLNGAKAFSKTNEFDLAVVIDVTFGQTPDLTEYPNFVGKGPVLTLGPSLSKEYNNKIRNYAKNNNINIQYEVEGGNTGTNAWIYHSSGISVPTIMISIPLKYMHTPYEVVSKNDISDTIKLVSGFLNEIF